MDGFQFYFQPKVDRSENRIVGYEILLRNTEKNPYYPAKQMEKIIYNKEAHSYFLEWFQEELIRLFKLFPNVIFSVNFAPRQLLYPETHNFFKTFQPYVEQLIIEITEEAPMFSESIGKFSSEVLEHQFQTTFASMKAMGYSISMDDVGSGKNSLDEVLKYTSYLTQIKFSIVKCNKKNLNKETLRHFLSAWKQVAVDYHLDFIIEGIEDYETSDEMKKYGIDIQQGYYFGKPSKYIVMT